MNLEKPKKAKRKALQYYPSLPQKSIKPPKVERSGIERELSSFGLAVIPIAVGLNWGFAFIASFFSLPLWLDNIGTLLAGIMAGPIIAGVSAALSFYIKAITFDSSVLLLTPAAIIIGIASGLLYGKGILKERIRSHSTISCALLLGIIAGLYLLPEFLFTSAFIDKQANITLGMQAFTAQSQNDFMIIILVLFSTLGAQLIDKIISLVIALAIAKKLPPHFKVENIKKSVIQQLKND